VHYFLFVTYFPHLIAGPVLHHNEMMPQFRKLNTYRVSKLNVAVGLTIFTIGLFKKVGIADSLAPYSNAAFDASEGGYALTFLEAWAGVLAYTFQLYFDFSGYSDMAIGLSRMFNVTLPLNFHSPYKATNIIDFWRRWHMTLSRFLRDYLYVSLGGNRLGRFRRYLNLIVTMLLGGLWHGAGWTFVVWGGLHGLYLIINHAWRWFWKSNKRKNIVHSSLSQFAGMLLTFLTVVIAWVFFRSESLSAAISMLNGLLGHNGLVLQAGWQARLGGLGDAALHVGASFGELRVLDSVRILGWLGLLTAACMTLPNTQEIVARYKPALDFRPTQKALMLVWQPNLAWGATVGALMAVAILLISRKSEFLYFQF
jgi:D-alanyl-lipoteichoic acid acyltransferase DltB (MBOAT superfamily)